MNPALSQFGQQMSHLTGVRAIMKDIIETLQRSDGQDFIDLSAGNPVILPEIEQMWRDCTRSLLDSDEYGEVVCRYGSSQGYQPLVEAIANDFNRRYGLSLTPRNILISPGSQSLYFFGANAFGGYTPSGALKRVVLPLSPDYTGYGGVSLAPEAVVSYKPSLDIDEANHAFKYRPDFSQLDIGEDTGCVIFSRPSNPTGNVLSDGEVDKIAQLAAAHHAPVFIDSAYAPPFPALNFTEMTPQFGGNVVHCLSLSKAGLPGERVGVAIADEAIIEVLQSFQTNACIHSSRYGQAIAARAIASGQLAELSQSVIRPHYQQKFAVLSEALQQYMPADLPWFLHRGEGAIFAWIWFRNLPTSDRQLYNDLKQAGVIAVPGEPFFPGLREDWTHKRECLRISLTATPEALAEAMRRLAEVASRVYRTAPVG